MAERYSKSIQRRRLGNFRQVTPVNQKIDNSVANAWGQVAQSGNKLFNQFAQYAREDARHQAIIDAEGAQFERGPDGLTVMPPPPTQGGTIYQKNYNAVINDIYKREIKTDIESNLSKIYAEKFTNPDEMSDLLNNSLGSIVSNIAPQHQTEMTRIGQNYINTYNQSAIKEKTRRLFNAKVVLLKSEHEKLIERRLTFNLSQDEIASIDEDLLANFKNRNEMGIVVPEQNALEQQTIQNFANWENIKQLMNGRSSSSDGALLNDTGQMTALAELFEGWEGGKTSNSVTFFNTNGDPVIYTREDIERLIPDPSLRAKMATAIKKRVTFLEEGTTKNKNEIAYEEFHKFVDSGGTGKHNTISNAVQEQYWVDRISAIPSIKNINGVANLRTHFQNGPDNQIIVDIIDIMDKHKIIPDFILKDMNQMSFSSREQLANYYVPFYNQIIKDKNLREIWDTSESISNSQKGNFEALYNIIGFDEDILNNEQEFARIVDRVKVNTSKNLNENFQNIIAQNDIGFNVPQSGDMVKNYTRAYINEHKLLPPNAMTDEIYKLIHKESVEYLKSVVTGGETDLEKINQVIERNAQKYKDVFSEDTFFKGAGLKKTDNESLWQGNSPTTNESGTVKMEDLPRTPENNRLLKINKHIERWGGDKKYSHFHNNNISIIQNYINAIEEEGGSIPMFDDVSNIRYIDEMPYKQSIANVMNFQGGSMPREGKGPIESQEGFYVTYKGKKIAMIPERNYVMYNTSEGIGLIIIDDDGTEANRGTRTITGIVDNERGEPLYIDGSNYLKRKIDETDSIQKIKADEKRVKKVNREKQGDSLYPDDLPYTQPSPKEIEEMNNEIKGLNFRIEQEKILNNLLEDINIKPKENINISSTELPSEGTGFVPPEDWEGPENDPIDDIKSVYNIQNVSFVGDIPPSKDSGIITANAQGIGVVVDASNIVANWLDGGDVESTRRMLIEIAVMETDSGENPDTYNFEKNKDMGIWQNERAMRHIQDQLSKRTDGLINENAKKLEDGINNLIPEINFSFANMTVEDLRIPVISASVARLYIANQDPDPIGKTVLDRGKTWSKYYNTSKGKGGYLDWIKKLKAWGKKGELEKLTKNRINEV